MPTYTSSQGISKDTADMALQYIQYALAKAKEENNLSNILALEEELKIRAGDNRI